MAQLPVQTVARCAPPATLCSLCPFQFLRMNANVSDKNFALHFQEVAKMNEQAVRLTRRLSLVVL